MTDITEFLTKHACLVEGHHFVCTECGAEFPRALKCFFCDAPGTTLVPLRNAMSGDKLYMEVCDACADRLRIDPNRGDWFLDECEHEWPPWQGPSLQRTTDTWVWTSACRLCRARQVAEGNQPPPHPPC